MSIQEKYNSLASKVESLIKYRGKIKPVETDSKKILQEGLEKLIEKEKRGKLF